MKKQVIVRLAPIPAQPAPKGKQIGVVSAKPEIGKAADIMKEGHPLHEVFMTWCKGKGTEPTKRQARKYCNIVGRKVA